MRNRSFVYTEECQFSLGSLRRIRGEACAIRTHLSVTIPSKTTEMLHSPNSTQELHSAQLWVSWAC